MKSNFFLCKQCSVVNFSDAGFKTYQSSGRTGQQAGHDRRCMRFVVP